MHNNPDLFPELRFTASQDFVQDSLIQWLKADDLEPESVVLLRTNKVLANALGHKDVDKVMPGDLKPEEVAAYKTAYKRAVAALFQSGEINTKYVLSFQVPHLNHQSRAIAHFKFLTEDRLLQYGESGKFEERVKHAYRNPPERGFWLQDWCCEFTDTTSDKLNKDACWILYEAPAKKKRQGQKDREAVEAWAPEYFRHFQQTPDAVPTLKQVAEFAKATLEPASIYDIRCLQDWIRRFYPQYTPGRPGRKKGSKKSKKQS